MLSHFDIWINFFERHKVDLDEHGKIDWKLDEHKQLMHNNWTKSLVILVDHLRGQNNLVYHHFKLPHICIENITRTNIACVVLFG